MPTDIQGFEYDWLACDAEGHVGFFSTAGAGYAPPELIEDTGAYDAAIEAIFAMPPSTRARFAPVVGAGCINTWQLMAERGVFAYDSDPTGGPYRLVSQPEHPISIDSLPIAVAAVVRRVVLGTLRFAELREVSGDGLARRDQVS